MINLGLEGIEELNNHLLWTNIIEKMCRINNPIYIAFVDLKNIFVIWQRELGKVFPYNREDMHRLDRRIIYKLYVNERAVIKGENEAYEEAEIQKSVRQGYSISPTLLINIYIEKAIIRAERWKYRGRG